MEASISRIRRSSRGQAALLLVLLTLCVPGSATGTPAEAPAAVPTCRGVPATIVGTPRDDVLRGTPGDDVIVAGRGVDDIIGSPGNDLLCGGPAPTFGFDVIQNLNGGEGDDTIVGGRHGEFIQGNAGSDVLIGNAGPDLMTGGDSRDILRGGPAADEMYGNGRSDRIFGGRGADRIQDDNGGNVLNGGDGSDVIDSGPGNETINGGSGSDTASYARTLPNGHDHCNDITADLIQGTASGAGFGVDVLQSIENVWTGGGNDVLIGNERPNGFHPGFPAEGDTCAGQPVESVSGNGGADRVMFEIFWRTGDAATGPVRVDLVEQTAHMSNPDGSPILFSLDSIENVTGTSHRDVLLGDDGPNSLIAGFFAFTSGDVIDGRGGADRLIGRKWNDRLVGGPGDDVLLGRDGDDHLDGGTGRNRNDGGRGIDTCLRPSRGSLAISCEL